MVPVLEQVLEQYPHQVKIYFKQFPLRNHRFAFKAAQATVAAHDQGKFWEFHDLVFENHNKLNDAKIEEIRDKLSLDKARFKASMNDPKTKAQISADARNGREAGVRSTPSVFINGKQLKNRTLIGFQTAINNELKQGKNITK